MNTPPDSKLGYFLVFITMIAALSGILFGYDTGVISGAILFVKEDFHLSAQMNGIVVSAVLLGALLGAAISGHLTDRFGRKRLLIADAVIFMVGTILTALSSSIFLLILGRIIVGLAIGVASYTAPLYISEIAPVRYRGALVSLNQLAITIGILLSYIVDYHFSAQGQWRWMFAAGLVPAILLLVGMFFLPYSPRWLVSRGHYHKALLVLQRIRGQAVEAELELATIKNSIQEKKASWKILFQKPISATIFIGVGLAIIQQITGINTIIYYAPTIFRMAGFDSNANAILASMGIGVVFVLFTILALPLIDTLGRRILLLTGLVGMALSLSLLSWTFSQNIAEFPALRWITLGSMLFYIACFAFSLGPIMWLMIAEIYPLQVRGLGSSVATCANWGSNMIVALTFLTLIDLLGASGVFSIYAILCMLSLLFVYFWVPETRGVSLEQIETNLHAGLSMRHLGKQQTVSNISTPSN